MKKHYFLLFSLFFCLNIAQLQANVLTDFAKKSYDHAWQIAGTALCAGSVITAAITTHNIVKHGFPTDYLNRCYYLLTSPAIFASGLLCFKAHSLSNNPSLNNNTSVSKIELILACFIAQLQGVKEGQQKPRLEGIDEDRIDKFLLTLDQVVPDENSGTES